ncbi:GtrA family protein [Sphingomonas naphthae]|uniref:GtrA family protein n=1 Tax=Sphingomonas naphthae TaxID=1813468 RepID=A0ABY7TJS4_9SPHN|nr:GtrA family protein [Sphingomonas naphthae]WCT73178.1 GtrA family protein [Sphingomonas naphthae]
MNGFVDRFAGALRPEQREVLGQLVRYGLTGGFVTTLYTIVYWLVLHVRVPLPPNAHVQAANLAGYLASAISGYFIHSGWSFRGHGSRDSHVRTGSRFFLVSLVSYFLNVFWVWLLVTMIGWSVYSPLFCAWFVTPMLVFWLQRKWVFD